MKAVRVASIFGARPQFIKAAAVSEAIRATNTGSSLPIEETLIHTGQHYDFDMSDIFIKELSLAIDHHLNIRNPRWTAQAAHASRRLTHLLRTLKPDLALVYGDTSSTLAGALAAKRAGIPVAHIEAGMRSYNFTMPEEISRVLTDHVSDILFCPNREAVQNLAKESIRKSVYCVGDVMFDSLLKHSRDAMRRSQAFKRLRLARKKYALVTIHRAGNTNNPARLKKIVTCLNNVPIRVVWPVHPRTRKILRRNKIAAPTGARMINPVSYLDMLALEKHAAFILTDSGGVQKEAYLLGIPCITFRDETEWTDTTEHYANQLVGVDCKRFRNALRNIHNKQMKFDVKNKFGDGSAGLRIVNIIKGLL